MTPRYRFVDPDEDVLELGFNHSFGHPSITLYAEEGVRMTAAEAEDLIEALKKLVEEAKGQ